jgi:hypothetical protein
VSKENAFLKELVSSEMHSNVDYLMSTASNFSQESKVMTFVDDIRSQFGAFIGRAATFFNSSKVGNFKPSTVIPGKLTEFANADGYRSIGQKVISIPLGFQGKYIDYIQALSSALAYVETLEKTIGATSQQLATVASEPDRMKAQSALRNLESLIKPMPASEFNALRAFCGNHGKTQARLSDVVDNGADIGAIYREVNNLNQRCSRVDWAGIDRKTSRLAELIVHVQKEIEAAGDGGTSGAAASALSTMVYGLATSVSAAAVVLSGVMELTHCLAQNVGEVVGA